MNTFKLRDLYFGLYEQFKRRAIKKYTRKRAEQRTAPSFSLTKEQLKELRDFYKPYVGKENGRFHRFFTQKTGFFSPYYLPTDIYINFVDEHFNCRAEQKFLDNKCYYPALFAGLPQPRSIAFRCGGLWYSGTRDLISLEQLKEIILSEKELFAKAATTSCGGYGVSYITAEKGNTFEQLERYLEKVKGDVIIQEAIKQHKDIAAIHESSVNTIRIISLLSESGVKIYSSFIRVGVDGKKVDNISSGGIAVGINDDGTLKRYAYRLDGERFEVHPTSGFVFANHRLPAFDKAKELVEKAHPMVPHFKLVSWDISITESGDPVMVEANLAKGSSDFHQLNNGPLFGEDTPKILDEVFGKNK